MNCLMAAAVDSEYAIAEKHVLAIAHPVVPALEEGLEYPFFDPLFIGIARRPDDGGVPIAIESYPFFDAFPEH